MKHLKQAILIAMVAIAAIAVYDWVRPAKTVNAGLTDSDFRKLADSLSAKSETVTIKVPYLQRVFGGPDKRAYDSLLKSIPAVIQAELDKQKGGTNTVTEITKTTLLLQGDTLMYRNSEGVVSPLATVTPLPGDSSLLVLAAQEIEITSVKAEPKEGGAQLYITAVNKTTGQTVNVAHSVYYDVAKGKLVTTSFKPYAFAGYYTGVQDGVQAGVQAGVGVSPVAIHLKKWDVEPLRFEAFTGAGRTGIFWSVKIGVR